MNNNQELTGVLHETRGVTKIKSWAQQHNRGSIILLGEVVELDEWLDWRVKWGQRGAAVCCAVLVLCYVLNSVFFRGHNLSLLIVVVVFFVGVVLSFGMIYYKNFSLVIARRLLEEVNVEVILVLGICLFIIDCAKPYNSFSPINGFVYLLSISLLLFTDAVLKKNRVFVLGVVSFFSLVTIWNIYDRTFNNTDVGIILFQYGDDYVFRKRSIKRSFYVQIFLFSLNGVWTMFKDKKMEKMVFAIGPIYRETGTASKYVEDRKHTERMRSESTELFKTNAKNLKVISHHRRTKE